MRRLVTLSCVVAVAVACAEEPCRSKSSETETLTLSGNVDGAAVNLVVNHRINVGDASPDEDLGSIVYDGVFGDPVFSVVADGDDGSFIVVGFFDVAAAGDYAVGPGAAVELRWTGAPGGVARGGTVHVDDAAVGSVFFVAEFAIDVERGAALVVVSVSGDNDEGGCA